MFERIKGLFLGAQAEGDDTPAEVSAEGSPPERPTSRLAPAFAPEAPLRADGDLTLVRMKGSLIATTIEVGGRLKVSQCGQLRNFPVGTLVGGDLVIEDCPQLESLPDGLKVAGSVHIRGCPRLAQIPRTLQVGGDLKIIGRTQIDLFPAGLAIDGDVVLKHAVRGLEAGKASRRNLALVHCRNLTRLPDGLEVCGDLIIRRTPLAEVPAGLVVGGGLELRFALVRSLPDDLSVGDFLDLEGCAHLETLPADLRVPGWLRVARCVRLRGVPRMVVGADRKARRSPWSRNELDRPHSPLMTQGNLSVENCRGLTRLEEGLQVQGSIEVGGAALSGTPESCLRNRWLWHGVRVPEQVAFAPETLTEQDVLGVDNQELRRVMLERIGLERFLALADRRGGLKVLHEDTDPGGVRRLLRINLAGLNDATVCLECRCPSTGRVYLLRVPPTARSCHVAAAWVAGFDDPDLYRPIVET